ncbi:MAG TPA: DinB family protein [Vicinamibacterales bacterium]|nr:DinB family protein [Vicinamibacterales bacterium]
MAIKDGILMEFDHEMATTRKLLERTPTEKLSWTPHDRSMSLGRLANHLSQLPQWADAILNQPLFDLANAPQTPADEPSSASIVAAFDRHVKAARSSLDKTDAEFVALWTLKRNGQEVFAMPRVSAFRSFVLYHMVHHRGQLSVYLRLTGVAVPSIYGPSADEG